MQYDEHGGRVSGHGARELGLKQTVAILCPSSKPVLSYERTG